MRSTRVNALRPVGRDLWAAPRRPFVVGPAPLLLLLALAAPAAHGSGPLQLRVGGGVVQPDDQDRVGTHLGPWISLMAAWTPSVTGGLGLWSSFSFAELGDHDAPLTVDRPYLTATGKHWVDRPVGAFQLGGHWSLGSPHTNRLRPYALLGGGAWIATPAPQLEVYELDDSQPLTLDRWVSAGPAVVAAVGLDFDGGGAKGAGIQFEVQRSWDLELESDGGPQTDVLAYAISLHFLLNVLPQNDHAD